MPIPDVSRRLRAIQLVVVAYGLYEIVNAISGMLGGVRPAEWIVQLTLGILIVLVVVGPTTAESLFSDGVDPERFGAGELTFGGVCALWTVAGGVLIAQGWHRPLGVIRWYTAFGALGLIATVVAYYRRELQPHSVSERRRL